MRFLINIIYVFTTKHKNKFVFIEYSEVAFWLQNVLNSFNNIICMINMQKHLDLGRCFYKIGSSVLCIQ